MIINVRPAIRGRLIVKPRQPESDASTKTRCLHKPEPTLNLRGTGCESDLVEPNAKLAKSGNAIILMNTAYLCHLPRREVERAVVSWLRLRKTFMPIVARYSFRYSSVQLPRVVGAYPKFILRKTRSYNPT